LRKLKSFVLTCFSSSQGQIPPATCTSQLNLQVKALLSRNLTLSALRRFIVELLGLTKEENAYRFIY